MYTLKFPKIEQNMHMRRPTGDYIPNKCSEVAEMGESLATIDMAENWRAVPFLRGRGPHLTQCGLGRGLLSCQVASSSIQPFGHDRHGPKICPFWGGGAGSPSSTMWPGPRPISYQLAS